jgi:hypothetical protein
VPPADTSSQQHPSRSQQLIAIDLALLLTAGVSAGPPAARPKVTWRPKVLVAFWPGETAAAGLSDTAAVRAKVKVGGCVLGSAAWLMITIRS